MMKELAVILVSGGIDSCVAAAIANQDHELAFLHANYEQLTQQRELDSFCRIADFYGVKSKLVCDFTWLQEIGGSSLTDPSLEEKVSVGQATQREAVPLTYVPFRNANLVCAAVSWAETMGARKILIGVVAQDAPHYPDTTPEFYEALGRTVRLGTKPDTDIEIVTPIIDMQKSEVVQLGTRLKAPLHLTWSCYKSNDLACGECESCLNRMEAFKLAGIKDPIRYA